MRSILRGLALALVLGGYGAAAVAQADARKDDLVAPSAASAAAAGASGAILAEPQPGETNAERAKTQPGNNAPFWRDVRNSGNAPGTVNNRQAGEEGVLVQQFVQYPGTQFTTAGEAWRQVRNHWIIPYGGSLVLIVALAILLYYFAKGPLGGHEPDTGRKIERFTYFERAAHWTNATAFVLLAVSGLVMAFGKFLLLPLIGATLFGWLTYALKTLHNFAGPLFAVSLTIVFLTFLRSNWPGPGDWAWLRRGGGLFGGPEPPSHRFNAGEKLVFWIGVFVFGGLVVGSGLVLDKLLPGLGYTRGDMQIAHLIHSIAALLMTCVFIGHIYIGTIGMRGSYRAMRTGYVDEGWAREHHPYWYQDIRDGKIPAQRSTPPRGRIEQPAA